MSVCVLWLVTVSYLAREYRGLWPHPASAVKAAAVQAA
jgi:hypothetical protein